MYDLLLLSNVGFGIEAKARDSIKLLALVLVDNPYALHGMLRPDGTQARWLHRITHEMIEDRNTKLYEADGTDPRDLLPQLTLLSKWFEKHSNP